jgi:hypothetical protein
MIAFALTFLTAYALTPLSPGSINIPVVGSVADAVAIDDAQALGSCSYANFHEVVWIGPQYYYVCTFGSDGYNWGYFWQLQYCASCGGGCDVSTSLLSVNTQRAAVRWSLTAGRTYLYEKKEPVPSSACM